MLQRFIITLHLVDSNFSSFTADEYKRSLIFTLLFRVFPIVLDFSKFHEEVKYLKNVFALVDKCIKIFLNRQFSQKISQKGIIYSFTISRCAFPTFEKTLTKKHQ